MTEYKPFSRRDAEPPVEERTVAVVLSIPPGNEELGRIALQPMGSLSLAQKAIALLQNADADERWLRHSDGLGADLVAPQGVVRLLDGEAQPRCTHLLLLGPLHPFLRASTLGEAVRLFKMRTDIASLVACTRNRDALYDPSGERVIGESSDRTLYRDAHAFQIVPRTAASSDGPLERYPFELSEQESFLVDSEFKLQLFRAWQERSPGRAF